MVDHNAMAKMYVDAVKNDKIDSEKLLKLPELVTCSDWSNVEILGSVSFTSSRTKIHFDGILVKYSGGLYYLKKKVADALGDIDKRFRHIKKTVQVTSD